MKTAYLFLDYFQTLCAAMFKTTGALLCGFLLGFLFNSSLYLIPEMTVRFAKC